MHSFDSERPTPFRSILFDRPGQVPAEKPPGCFPDVNLDQVVASLAVGREEYRLAEFFYTPLHRLDEIAYRHEVFRDLQTDAVRQCVRDFARRMHTMRKQLSTVDAMRYLYQRQRWFLDAAHTYQEAVVRLAQELTAVGARSRGLRGLADYLTDYTTMEPFTTLTDDIATVTDVLSAIRYSLTIRGDRVRVRTYGDEQDYTEQVTETFAKYAQGAVRDHRVAISEQAEMNHVEAAVLDLVARLNPQPFQALQEFCRAHLSFLDPVVADFDRQVQFYLAWLEHTERLAAAGLAFCYPDVSTESKVESVRDTFDVALADKLVRDGKPLVCNDFHLSGPERVIVVTGPNQGGKTTFARTFGQLHHLASLGCPVPGTSARLFIPDAVFTHFEKEENATDLRGKLADDLIRLREILRRATPDSVIILNEIFTSTALADALQLGGAVLRHVIDLDALCVCVTFVDEWASLGESTVSMASNVVPDDPARRTFRILRRQADGRAYAQSIADKYGLTYQRLKERIGA